MPLTNQGNAAMHRIKHQPLRNKINLADPAQVRAWARRLGVSADGLKAVVEKVGNSIAAATQGIELQRGEVPGLTGADPAPTSRKRIAGVSLHPPCPAL